MGFDVELAAERLDGGVEAEAGFGLLDVDAGAALAGGPQLGLEGAPLTAEPVELLGRHAGRFGLAAAPVVEPVGEGVDGASMLGEAAGEGGERLVAGEEAAALVLGPGLGRGVASGEARLDLGEAGGEHGPALLGGGASHLGGPGRGEHGAGGFDGALRLGAGHLRRGGAGVRLLEREGGDRLLVAAADVPGPVAAEAVAVGGDGDQVGTVEDEVERGRPVGDEDVAGEEPVEGRGEVLGAGPDHRPQGAGARRRVERRGGAVVGEDEEQGAGVTGVEASDRGAGRVGAAHDDGAGHVAERGGDRGFGAGFDLEVVDDRAEDPVDAFELAGRGVGARFA